MPVPVFAEMGYLGRNGQVSPKIESVLFAESVIGKATKHPPSGGCFLFGHPPNSHSGGSSVWPVEPRSPPGAPGAGDPIGKKELWLDDNCRA